MSAFKYEQLLLNQILDAFPVKVLFMRQASLPSTAVRSHAERIKEEKDAAQLAATTTGCGCRRMSPPGIDLWALILQGSPWGPHRSRSSLSLAGFKLCFTGSDTKPLASAPKLNLYSRLAFS